MKTTKFKKIICSNAPLKVISLILGYSFWYIIGHRSIINIWLTIPLSFYKIPDNIILRAPEVISVNITGKRSDLYKLDKKKLTVHINAHELSLGYNNVSITAETLLLPDNIKLIDYKPSNFLVEVRKNN